MNEMIDRYITYLKDEERSPATCAQYERELRKLSAFLEDRQLSKEIVIAYKQYLIERYKVSSANVALVAINGFLTFIERQDLRLKLFRQQRCAFIPKNKEISKEEYQKLIKAAKAKKDERMELLIETICSTGIRVSEVKYITKEAAQDGEAVIRMKGKTRKILLPDKLVKALLGYAEKNNIVKGPVFITRNGRPIDRSNIWKMMKALCKLANVEKSKVYPHSLRHLFARTFYAIDKDISKLADILGHTSINTTRIYIMSTGVEHKRLINAMGLI